MKPSSLRSRLLLVPSIVALGAAAWLAPAAAQPAAGTYPTGVVRIILAFGPGTGGDFLARLVAERLSLQTGGRFIVENRPGAGGATGTKAAADAAPDGQTLLLGSNATLIVNPTVNKNAPYDGATAFVPIGAVARTRMLLVTSAADGAPRSLAELVKRARAAPVSYASTGVGAFGHLTSELMLRRTGIQATHVPYKSSNDSLVDVSRGEVLFANDSIPATLPHLRGGRLRALAVTGAERVESLPDVPTFAEAGVPGMDITVWYALMAPAGTPAAVIDRLDAELTRMHADPAVRQRLHQAEFEPLALGAARFRPFFAKELSFWRQFVTDSGR